MTAPPSDVRVLVAHPRRELREDVAATLAREPGAVVVGAAATGRDAVRQADELRPDVIVLAAAISGPGVVSTTRAIMSTVPCPIIVVAADEPDQLHDAAEALAAGALSVQRLPGSGALRAPGVGARFAAVVRALADVSVVRRRQRTAAEPAAAPTTRPGVVAIAGSTGAPAALQQLLAGLPADLPVPILVVQHLPPGYVDSFVSWLDAATRLRVCVAAAGVRPEAGEVVLAADGTHLSLDRSGRIEADRSPPVDGFRPSASVLFRSVADVHGPEVLALVLSGMGRDGVAGLQRVRESGGYVVAQDEATSVVFGMAGAAVAAGLAHRVEPADALASVLVESLGQRSGER